MLKISDLYRAQDELRAKYYLSLPKSSDVIFILGQKEFKELISDSAFASAVQFTYPFTKIMGFDLIVSTADSCFIVALK